MIIISTVSDLQGFLLSLLFLWQCSGGACSVTECLVCLDVPVTQLDERTFVADTTDCKPQTCMPNPKDPGREIVCSSMLDLSGTASYHSSCFPYNSRDLCPMNMECEVVSLGFNCCCHENNCANGTITLPPASNAPTGTSTELSPTPTPFPSPTPLPTGSSSSEVLVAILVIAAVLGLGLLAVALVVLYCLRQHLKRLCSNCCHKPRPPVVSHTYRSRYSQPWVLQGLVGQGRFGHVYKALHNGEIVAVKVYSHHK